ncbi:MAG: hypothetical protein D6681_21745 [Calditrichaeota bacterium]|nr:MAG: hypothetical protein D6681_21745 [Calditrichota bacterium]
MAALLLLGWSGSLSAQFYKTLRGDPTARRKNVHSGNQVRTTFFNYGLIGRISPDDFGGEWPINSGHEYVGDISVMVGAEVELPDGTRIHPVTVADGPRGSNEFNPNDPNDYWGWEPLPGFANPDTNIVAMSHLKESWPDRWPDRETDALDPGWPGQWNGFFGKDQFNADQESYWWMDDSRDREFMLSHGFYPDSTDAGNPVLGGSRGGLGLLASARGFQWSQALAQNTIFWLYEITNVGTTLYDKTVFGVIVGTTIGGDGDTQDDNSFFDTEEDLTYSWDNDLIGNSSDFFPVDMLGYAFLESPGNAVNGYDDDNDAADVPGGDVIDESILVDRTVQVGDPVVVIDYDSPTFERSVINFPPEGIDIRFRNRVIHIAPGTTLHEVAGNNIDDNLNGLIDENVEIAGDGIDNNGNGEIDEINPHIGLKYINYFTGAGTENPMIDEARSDMIDNDGDWDPTIDDVGLDGKPDTGDEGEGDGQPTSGFRRDPLTGEIIDTGLPGEPNIDKTDIDESDQIGLTSFFFFQPFNAVRLNRDDQLWQTLRPGFFDDDPLFNADGDFIYGTGYFPLQPGQTERISLAFFFTEWKSDVSSTLRDLIRTKEIVQVIYNNDYNFAKAPLLPTVRAVAGDNKVTLYWDTKAEESFDRLSLKATGNGFDFEGYKIYRATFPSFDETGVVTNVFGSRVADVPIAQFDLVNEFTGFFPEVDQQLGTVFYLGDNTGLVHTYTDSSVKNGFTYFYAVTAYDHGVLTEDETLFPAETSKFAAITASGGVTLGRNVVMVRPEAPVAGYVNPDVTPVEHLEGDGTGELIAEPIDPLSIRDGHTYEITFSDTGFVRSTSGFTVVNVTTGDTVVAFNPNVNIDAVVVDGIKLHIINGGRLLSSPRMWQAIPTNPTFLSWEDSTANILPPLLWGPFQAGLTQGTIYPANYRLEVGEPGVDSAAAISLFGIGRGTVGPINFRIKNVSEDHYIDVNLYDLKGPGGPDPAEQRGLLDEGDLLALFERDENGVPRLTFQLKMATDTSGRYIVPRPGDVLPLTLDEKPLLAEDVFRFTAVGPKVDIQEARNSLSRIKVVPNPYVATAIWEPRNVYASGRGERSIHFIHLPQKCTIRIFNVRGELVDVIHHDSDVTDGTADWDLLSKDNLEVAYGVYIYHVDAPGIGQITGKFAVIK